MESLTNSSLVLPVEVAQTNERSDIKAFLAPSHGYGNGHGHGYGNGHGDGNGDGHGDGHGNGHGYGNGDGYGYGDGYGDGDGYGYGNGYGNGHGHGYGHGYGDGHGHGNGHGYGDGHGNGHGDGHGNGYGDGHGDGPLKSLQSLDGSALYNIDGVPTAIDQVRGNVAKCRVLAADMTWRPCWVARVDDCWAHGDTLREAMRDAQAKALADKPLDERLAMFREQYHTLGTKVPAKVLYQWHNTLTGSCEFGRRQFCTDNNIDLDAEYTVREFIDLTRGSYGGDVIKKLKELYK